MARKTTKKRPAKKRGPLATCAAKLGRKGGQATARKRKAAATRRAAKARKSRQLSLL